MEERLNKTGLDSLKHRGLTEKVIGIFFEVYNELGYGFLGSVYENAMVIALNEKELSVQQQIPIPVWFRSRKVGDFYADLLIENTILLELKAVRALDEAHKAQLLNYLRGTEIEVGLLLNFGTTPEFKRLAFDNHRKKARRNAPLSVSSLLISD